MSRIAVGFKSWSNVGSMPWMLFGPIMLSLFAIACVLAVMYVTSMVQRCGISFFQARNGFVHGSAQPQ